MDIALIVSVNLGVRRPSAALLFGRMMTLHFTEGVGKFQPRICV